MGDFHGACACAFLADTSQIVKKRAVDLRGKQFLLQYKMKAEQRYSSFIHKIR